MRKLLYHLLTILIVSCTYKSEPLKIKHDDVKKIIVYTDYETSYIDAKKIVHITNKDSIHQMIYDLNDSKFEPGKFLPSHAMQLIQKDDSIVNLILFRGAAMSINGVRYNLNKSIEEIVK